MTPIQIFINPADRLQLATTIQSLIDLMDSMEPDCDLEDGGDHEPNLGWPAGHGLPQLAKNVCHDDEREDENEHGGDILDEPHDDEEDCCSAGEDLVVSWEPSSTDGNDIARKLLRQNRKASLRMAGLVAGGHHR